MNYKDRITVTFVMVLLVTALSACANAEQPVTMGTASGDYVSPALATLTVGKTLNDGVWTVVGCLVAGALVGAVLWGAGKARKVQKNRLVPVVVGLLVFVILLGMLALGAASVSVDAGRVGVLVSQGTAIQILEPGFHLITPYWQKVVTFSSRDWTFITMTDPVTQGSEEYRTYPLSIITKDGISASVKFSMQGRLDSTKALYVYQHYGTLENAIVQLIKSPSLGIVRTRVQGFSALDMVNNIDAVSEDVASQLRPTVENGGITMVFFSFRKPDLGDWEKELNNARIAEQQAAVAKEQVAIAEANAQKAAAEAEGARQVTEINAKAQAAATLAQRHADADADLYKAQQAAAAARVAADADAYATLVRAKAEAESNAQVAASLTTNLILYTAWSNWNGQLPTMMTGETAPVISLPSSPPTP